MIKVSETRSAMRRLVLTKAAAPYGSELATINNSVGGHYGAAASRAGAGLGSLGKAVGGTYSAAYNLQNGVNTQSSAYKANSGQQATVRQQTAAARPRKPITRFVGGGQPRPGGTLTAANAADMKTFKGGRPGTRLGLPADNKEYLKRFYGSYADQAGRVLRNAGRKVSPFVSSLIGFRTK